MGMQLGDTVEGERSPSGGARAVLTPADGLDRAGANSGTVFAKSPWATACGTASHQRRQPRLP
jgi:hypothetical protein